MPPAPKACLTSAAFWQAGLLALAVAASPVSADEKTADQGPPLTPELESYLESLQPRHNYHNLLRDLFRLVDRLHYIDKNLDRAFSLTTFEHHLENLDPQHNLFLESDVRQFEKLKPGIYKAIHGRNLMAPYSMYRLRQKRAAQSMLYQIELLENHDFHFDRPEYLEVDRDEAKPFENWTEWKDYWRRAIKNQLLLGLLDEKPLDETAERLKKRLRNRIKTLMRSDFEDALASFVNSALSQYDPHTSYLPPQEYEDWITSLQTKLEGIGAVLSTRDDYVYVSRLIEGGPASKSSLRVGDRITGVISRPDEEFIDVVGMNLHDVVRLIRGKKGSPVVLEILSAGADPGAPTYNLKLIRDVIPIENQRASSEILEINAYDRLWRIGIIRLPSFYSDNPKDNVTPSASKDVQELLRQLRIKGADGLILDLRNNGGGYLDEALKITSLFLPAGAFVLIRNQGNRITPDGKTKSRQEWTGPMAVLVGRLSASASEIVAAAIQDYKRGLVLGATTFGKGTVQNTYDLGREQGQLKLTRSKFYRVNGGATQGKGVIPDLVLPSIWNPEKIGESAYDNALPFDTIKAMKLHHQSAFRADLSLLRRLHEKRRQAQLGLQYLDQRRELLDQLTEDKLLPLEQEARALRQQTIEEKQLQLENRIRQAENLEAFDEWEQYLDWEREQSSDPDYKPRWEEIIKTEASQVLIDYLHYNWRTQTAAER